jgi:hypothetical protein
MPCGLLRDAEIAADFVAADAVLAGDKQPYGGKPLFKSDRAFLEDGSSLQCEGLTLTSFVLAIALPNAVLFKSADTLRSAPGALHHAIRPTQFDHEHFAVLEIGEVQDSFLKGLRFAAHIVNMS